MSILNKIKSFINNHSYTENEQFIKDKITIINIIMIVMAPSILFFAVFRYSQHEYIQAFFDFILVLSISLGLYLLHKDKKYLLLVARLILFFSLTAAVMVIVRMDYIDTRFSWISLLTYLIFYFVGAKEGRVWFGVMLLTLISLFMAKIIHISLLEFSVFIIVNTLLAFFLIQNEKIKEMSEHILLNHTKNLKKAVDEKTLELQDQKDILELLFQKSHDGTLLIENNKFVKCNDSVVRLLGYKSPSQLLYKHPSELSPEFQPDGKLSSEKADEMMQLCRENGSHIFEWVYKKANDETFWCDVTLTHLKVQDKEMIHSILRDISDKKFLELENKKMYENLEQEVQNRTNELYVANRVKGDFLANMSHEIRTPLNAILGFISILKKGETDAKRKKHFDIVERSGETLLTIINDILDFSKMESGKLSVEHVTFDVKKLFEDVYALFSEKAKTKKIHLILKLNAEVPDKALGDVVRIKQIVSNLLSNAIKFTKENGEVTIEVWYRDGYLYCDVTDTGIGIDKDNLSKVFSSFSQADSSTTRNFGGTGLGLSISKQLVELMGGSIDVKSVVNSGTTFSFNIKLKRVGDKMDYSVEEEAFECIFEEDNKVLIVEDNKTNQMLLEMLLMELDLKCDIVDNGEKAVKQVQEKMYDIVLMDENMPVLNGMEATKKIREFDTSLPIIAVTANALVGDKDKFMKAGMNDYLSKPINVELLIKVLKKYLTLKSA